MSRVTLKLKYPITEFELDADENSLQFLWIPITERQPDKRGDYLVFTSDSTITVATWGGEHFYISEFAAVTHWMPLPAPPESESET